MKKDTGASGTTNDYPNMENLMKMFLCFILNHRIVFGIIIPAICLAFDPIVFTGFFGGYGSGEPSSLLGDHFVGFYGFFVIQFCFLACWTLKRNFFSKVSCVFSGVFASGFLVSAFLSIILFPFSILGAVILIGLLGFTPMMTGYLYGKCCTEAYQSSSRTWSCKSSIAISAFLVLALPFSIEMLLARKFDRIKGEIASGRPYSLREIKTLRHFITSRELDLFDSGETDPIRKLRLNDAYRKITQ